VRVDGDGTILNVINSMAPISRKIVRHNASPFRSIAVMRQARRPLLANLIANPRERNIVMSNGKPVLVPVNSGTGQGMVKADHIVWTNSQHELQSGFLLVDKTVLAPAVVPATQNDKSIPIAHIDQRTKLPTFLSYRPRGGLAVSAVGIFSNPAEIAYRYLEEHREVFGTGAPRCQFEIVDVRTSTFHRNTTFVKLGQVMAGRRVFGAELVFEIESGNRVQTIQGHTIDHILRLDVQISPNVAESRAIQQLDAALINASANLRNEARRKPITTELGVFPGELVAQPGLSTNPPTRLAYHVRSMLHGLFVDAISGETLYGYSLNQAANIVREAGGRTILEKPIFAEVSRNGTVPPGVVLSPDALAAIPVVTGTANFYGAHGWRGTDGSGSHMVANVNVNLFTCPNAFSPPIDEESYFCTGEAVGDIVAHELTHGVIWNSSNLTYADESGALNESFADIMGNLAFPDVVPAGSPPGTLPGWLVGEAGVAASIRNMANPAATTPVGQPVNYAGYLSRNALGCSPADTAGLIPPCDFGGVHTNSGIHNRAYVLMSDGGLASLVGMGRGKTRMLAFDVMALRLSAWSTFIDSAIATKASCDAALASGLTDLTGASFAQIDCDQIPGSFAAVGLDPDLFSDWSPPIVEFRGTDSQFSGGETTVNGCIITDLTLQMRTPGGLMDSQASVVPGGAPLFVSYFGLITATIAVTRPPIGGMTKTHAISWTSSFPERPEYRSVVTAPTTVLGNSNCRGDFVTERKTSVTKVSDGIPWVGGSGTTTTGFFFSTMNPACVLIRTEVELVKENGDSLDNDVGPTSDWSDVVWIACVPVTLERSATITSQPPGPLASGGGSFDLSAPVSWSYSAGVKDVRWRLVYTIDKPPGLTCTP
jgi:Zn-dependent metalloprotease